VLFSIRILVKVVVFSLLLLLGGAVTFFDSAQFALHVTLFKDLLASHVFGLESPEFLLLFGAGLHHLLFSTLLGAFVEDSFLLLGAETLEVVGLNSVGSKHRLFGHRVFSHEIMGGCEFNFSNGISFHHSSLVDLLVSLGLGHHGVLMSDSGNHSFTLGIMVVLGNSEKRCQMALLLMVHLFVSSSLVSIKLFLSFLLGDPVGLL